VPLQQSQCHSSNRSAIPPFAVPFQQRSVPISICKLLLAGHFHQQSGGIDSRQYCQLDHCFCGLQYRQTDRQTASCRQWH
jgi:hypothetical protein